MNRVVLDNSAVCRYRFRETGWQRVSPLIQAIQDREVDAYAPPHLLVEFFQVARKKAASLADPRRAVKRQYDWLMSLPIQYVDVDYLAHARDLRLLIDQGAGSYDAIYIHLARQQGLPLCTCDRGIVALHTRIPRLRVFDLDRSTFSL